jgi:hypothetical protein
MNTRDFHIYVFDLTRQEERETFESFVYRLICMAGKCGFASENEELKRAIISKCRLNSLRSYVFENVLSLAEVIDMGKHLEMEAIKLFQ